MRLFILCLAVVTFAAPAFAQQEKQPKPPRTQVLDMTGEGDIIEGTLDKPDVIPINSREGADFGSLIRIRTDFKDRITQSFQEL